MPNQISVVFHNGWNYDYHFIIKKLVNQFERQFECPAEIKEQYKDFPVPIKKEISKIDKDCNESVETISYKGKFIDSMGFIARSLSNLVDNLAEEIHKMVVVLLWLFSWVWKCQ